MSIEELTANSPYDSSFTVRYKQAIRLNVPVKYVLIRPASGEESRIIDTFDLEDNQDAIFLSIFDVVRQLVLQDNTITLTQIWDIISKFKGDQFNPLDLPFIWLHALPEFRIDNDAVYQQITIFLSSQGEIARYTSMAQVLDEYQRTWLPDYQREMDRDIATVRGFVQSQQEIANIAPFYHSEITIDSVKVAYDYSTPPGINPLPDYFNSANTSYVVPFVQYNLQAITGETDSVERYYKIYKGRSIDSRPVSYTHLRAH